METHVPEPRILSWLECIPVNIQHSTFNIQHSTFNTQDTRVECLSYFNLTHCGGLMFFQGNMLLYSLITPIMSGHDKSARD